MISAGLIATTTAASAATESAYSILVPQAINQGDISLGVGFTPTKTIEVTSLGYYDETGAGLLASHEVGIFDAGGNLIADATVPSGASLPLIASFRYQSIAPVTLLAGHVYNLEGETGSSDPWASPGYSADAINPLITPLTINYLYQSDNVLRDTALVGNFSSGGNVYGAANFLFATGGVLEPASWAMMLIGLGGLGAVLRERRHRPAVFA